MDFEELSTRIPAGESLIRGVNSGHSLHIRVEKGAAEVTIAKFGQTSGFTKPRTLGEDQLLIITGPRIATIHNPIGSDLILVEEMSLG